MAASMESVTHANAFNFTRKAYLYQYKLLNAASV